MQGTTKGSKRLRRKRIKVEEYRVIRKKAKNPGAGGSVNAQRHERGNHNAGLDMVEESGEVEEKNAANSIGRNAVPGLKAKEGGGIGGGEEFTGSKLIRTQKIVTKVERA